MLNKSRFFCSALLFFIGFSAPIALCDVTYIDARPISFNDGHGERESIEMLVTRDQLRSDLYAGVYENLNIEMAISGSSDSYFQVTRDNFKAASSSVQNQILDNLLEYHTEAFLQTYRSFVDTAVNRLSTVGFFDHLGIQSESLTGSIGAERLLSDYARQWAYRTSQFNGPNCWHSSIASTNKQWKKHRYMNPYEFLCQLRRGYRQLNLASEKAEYGDVISLVDYAGSPVHALVFLGPDSRVAGRNIVFTKNGYMRGSYLFQDYNTVVNYIYPGTRAIFYRASNAAFDPSEHSGTGCDQEYDGDLESFLGEQGLAASQAPKPDPVIVAGLKKVDSRKLPALEL